MKFPYILEGSPGKPYNLQIVVSQPVTLWAVRKETRASNANHPQQCQAYSSLHSMYFINILEKFATGSIMMAKSMHLIYTTFNVSELNYWGPHKSIDIIISAFVNERLMRHILSSYSKSNIIWFYDFKV